MSLYMKSAINDYFNTLDFVNPSIEFIDSLITPVVEHNLKRAKIALVNKKFSGDQIDSFSSTSTRTSESFPPNPSAAALLEIKAT